MNSECSPRLTRRIPGRRPSHPGGHTRPVEPDRKVAECGKYVPRRQRSGCRYGEGAPDHQSPRSTGCKLSSERPVSIEASRTVRIESRLPVLGLCREGPPLLERPEFDRRQVSRFRLAAEDWAIAGALRWRALGESPLAFLDDLPTAQNYNGKHWRNPEANKHSRGRLGRRQRIRPRGWDNSCRSIGSDHCWIRRFLAAIGLCEIQPPAADKRSMTSLRWRLSTKLVAI